MNYHKPSPPLSVVCKI